MRFNKLDLNLLVALDVLLKERSVTQAAQQLNLSTSAMSNSLSKLREYFNDDLLVSIGRKMEITPRGQVLHDAVRHGDEVRLVRGGCRVFLGDRYAGIDEQHIQ